MHLPSHKKKEKSPSSAIKPAIPYELGSKAVEHAKNDDYDNLIILLDTIEDEIDAARKKKEKLKQISDYFTVELYYQLLCYSIKRGTPQSSESTLAIGLSDRWNAVFENLLADIASHNWSSDKADAPVFMINFCGSEGSLLQVAESAGNKAATEIIAKVFDPREKEIKQRPTIAVSMPPHSQPTPKPCRSPSPQSTSPAAPLPQQTQVYSATSSLPAPTRTPQLSDPRSSLTARRSSLPVALHLQRTIPPLQQLNALIASLKTRLESDYNLSDRSSAAYCKKYADVIRRSRYTVISTFISLCKQPITLEQFEAMVAAALHTHDAWFMHANGEKIFNPNDQLIGSWLNKGTEAFTSEASWELKTRTDNLIDELKSKQLSPQELSKQISGKLELFGREGWNIFKTRRNVKVNNSPYDTKNKLTSITAAEQEKKHADSVLQALKFQLAARKGLLIETDGETNLYTKLIQHAEKQAQIADFKHAVCCRELEIMSLEGSERQNAIESLHNHVVKFFEDTMLVRFTDIMGTVTHIAPSPGETEPTATQMSDFLNIISNIPEVKTDRLIDQYIRLLKRKLRDANKSNPENEIQSTACAEALYTQHLGNADNMGTIADNVAILIDQVKATFLQTRDAIPERVVGYSEEKKNKKAAQPKPRRQGCPKDSAKILAIYATESCTGPLHFPHLQTIIQQLSSLMRGDEGLLRKNNRKIRQLMAVLADACGTDFAALSQHITPHFHPLMAQLTQLPLSFYVQLAESCSAKDYDVFIAQFTKLFGYYDTETEAMTSTQQLSMQLKLQQAQLQSLLDPDLRPNFMLIGSNQTASSNDYFCKALQQWRALQKKIADDDKHDRRAIIVTELDAEVTAFCPLRAACAAGHYEAFQAIMENHLSDPWISKNQMMQALADAIQYKKWTFLVKLLNGSGLPATAHSKSEEHKERDGSEGLIASGDMEAHTESKDSNKDKSTLFRALPELLTISDNEERTCGYTLLEKIVAANPPANFMQLFLQKLSQQWQKHDPTRQVQIFYKQQYDVLQQMPDKQSLKYKQQLSCLYQAIQFRYNITPTDQLPQTLTDQNMLEQVRKWLGIQPQPTQNSIFSKLAFWNCCSGSGATERDEAISTIADEKDGRHNTRGL